MRQINKSFETLLCLLTLFIGLALSGSAWALEPPREGEIEKYKQDGSFVDRLIFAQALGNHKVRPDLLQHKIAMASQNVNTAKAMALPYTPGLTSKGTSNVLALLIEFPDYLHTVDPETFTSDLFGDGTTGFYPFESLKNFYYRSSYHQLTIQGNVLGWYKAQKNRNQYGVWPTAPYTLIKEALDYYKAQGVDFSSYDNNLDGKIDYFIVYWTGPDTGWGSTWWAQNDMGGDVFKGDPYTVSGKFLGVFSWIWEKNDNDWEPTSMVSCHETGHALGLPDYYSYATGNYGIGAYDMMDADFGDHNCFSKWLLDWLAPNNVINANDGIHHVTLNFSAESKDCAMIMPNADVHQPFAEYFMVQNRYWEGNDWYFPWNGMYIWHVDATLNDDGDNFKFDNSFTEHKLLKLMDASGTEEIELGYPADEATFYVYGSELSPASFPNSNDYTDAVTGIVVDNFSEIENHVMTADFTITGQIQYSLRTLLSGSSHIYGTVTPLQGRYTPGTVVTLVATPEVGYTLQSWLGTDNDASTDTINTVTMTKSKTITVTFVKKTDTFYTITASVVGGNGKLWPLDLTYLEGTEVVISCEPDSGYQVKQWTGTDNDALKTATNTVTMTGNKNITVEFEPIPASAASADGTPAKDGQAEKSDTSGILPGDLGVLGKSCTLLTVPVMVLTFFGFLVLVRIKE